MVNRTEYYKAIKGKFPECRFTETEEGMFHVELRGKIIASIEDEKMFKVPPEDFAKSVTSQVVKKAPVKESPPPVIEPEVAQVSKPLKLSERLVSGLSLATQSEPPKRRPGRPKKSEAGGFNNARQ